MAVSVRNLTFAYHKDAGNVFEDVSFDIAAGECVAILGYNGVGKSTLLKCMDRICHAESGEVLVDGQDIFSMTRTVLAQHIAYVPQTSSARNMTVFDAILLGRRPYIKWDATSADKAIVSQIIAKMQLEHLALRNVAELSGGEGQKVLLARALAQEPRLLLLDEPTSNLDPRNQHKVLRIIRGIAQEYAISVAIVIHDLNLAIRYCDRFVFLKDARVYACGGLETMTPAIIEQAYQIRAHVIEYNGIPLIVPYPDEARG